MRDLLAIRKTEDVLEYAGRFEQAKHRVLVHNKTIDDVFFVQKFLDGLKYNIRNAIALHKPRTVDAALSLALMQEEILEANNMRFSTRQRTPHKPLSSPVAHKSNNSATTPGILGSHPAVESSATRPKWEDKLGALRAARRAKGLCMKCGETYSPQHKCPKQISLQVLEEVLEAFQADQQSDHSSDSSRYCAAVGVQGKKTIKLQGRIGNQEILILVDSGSPGTFISANLVDKLNIPVTESEPVQVTVAGGGKLQSAAIIPNLSWWTQGNVFQSEAKVLELGCYDLILGMDWLEKFSPMWVHWKRKKLRFTYQGRRITLTGVKDCTSQCNPLKGKTLKGLLRKGGVAHMVHLAKVDPTCSSDAIPEDIHQLIQQHSHLFQEPTSLPPRRSFDHAIPLIQGVKPVNVKPYRYSPTQKDEIERQVKEMLLNGVIQPSSSPFASPVLLVKKKDGT